jgi:hypothetical protein
MIDSMAANRVWAVARPTAWILIAAALIAPAVAMRFTTEVQWTTLDFIAAATVLIGAGLVCEAFAWRVRNGIARILFSLAMVVLVGLLWAMAIN